MNKFGSRLWKRLLETMTNSLFLSLATAFFVFAVSNRHFYILDDSAITFLGCAICLLQLLSLAKFARDWKEMKGQEQAKQIKEQENAAKAELYLSGPMQSWK